MRLLPLRVWLFAFAGVAAAQNPPGPDVAPFVGLNAPVFALEHVRVIDGTGAAAREDQTVVINRGKIEWVGDLTTAKFPEDTRVLDLHGYTVIPGLVGMHEHMFYPAGDAIFHEMPISFPDSILRAESRRLGRRAALSRTWTLRSRKRLMTER